MIDPLALISLIHDLDKDDETDGNLSITRWREPSGSGDTDIPAERLVRALAREKLGSFPLADIGAALLTDIDNRSADL